MARLQGAISVFYLSLFLCAGTLLSAASVGHSDGVTTHNGGPVDLRIVSDGSGKVGSQGMHFSLKHRDSPGSPFRQRFNSRQDVLRIALKRDELRAKAFVDHINKRQARLATGNWVYEPADELLDELIENNPLIPPSGAGEYYTELYVGTPNQVLVAMVDISSDLVWISEPSSRILAPPRTRPIRSFFFPASSISFTQIPSDSESCRSIKGIRVKGRAESCRVMTGTDGKYNGAPEFAYEVLSLNATARHRVLISIGKAPFATGGILGLGRGPTSLASQLARNSHQVPAHARSGFSYCLADTDEPSGSSLTFGIPKHLKNIQYTPLIPHPRTETFYCVNLVGISVNGAKLSFPSKASELTIVDPGTRFSRLSPTIFNLLLTALQTSIHLPTTTSVPSFPLCYNVSNYAGALPFPTITFLFQNGASMKLPVDNSFISGTEQGELMCLAMLPAAAGDGGRAGVSILGGTQQQNFGMHIESRSSRLGFAPKQCASSTL